MTLTDAASFRDAANLTVMGCVLLLASILLLAAISVRAFVRLMRTRKRKRSPTLLAVEDASQQIQRLAEQLAQRDQAIERLTQRIEHREQQQDTDSRVVALQQAGEQLLTSYDVAEHLLDNALTTFPSLIEVLKRFKENAAISVREYRKSLLADCALNSLLGKQSAPAPEPTAQTPPPGSPESS